MKQGRKKKNCKKERRTFHCGDMTAWNLCKQKKVKISMNLTRIIQLLGYKPNTSNLHNLNCLRNFLMLQVDANRLEEERRVLQLRAKFLAERKFLGLQITKLTEKETELNNEAKNNG